MLKPGEIAERIVRSLARQGSSRPPRQVEEVRIGLGYTAVKIEGEKIGLAAVYIGESPRNCQPFNLAGKLKGADSGQILELLVSGNSPVEKAVGLATANALIRADFPCDRRDAIELMKLGPGDRVAMVGLFPPLRKKIEETGAKLTIIERDERKAAPLGKDEKNEVMRSSTVAIITATTILNGTVEEVLNELGEVRHAALLGPSTPMLPDVFGDTPVNHLGGALVADETEVMRIISEGGGTPAMRSHLDFINLVWKKN